MPVSVEWRSTIRKYRRSRNLPDYFVKNGVKELKPMTTTVLTPTLLSASAFAPFGAVLEVGDKAGLDVNSSWADQIDQDPAFAHSTGQALPVASIYRNRPRPWPVVIDEIERHPLSSQLFMPMTASRWLVVVVPDDDAGEPGIAKARAFLANAHQGICYRPGTWHSPLIGLDAESEFFVLMWSRSPTDDTDVRQPEQAIQVRLD